MFPSELHTGSFNEMFQGANVGIEAVCTSSLNLNTKAKFQNAAVKMLTLIPTYDKNASSKRLTKEVIKQREMEVHQGCIGVLLRELNPINSIRYWRISSTPNVADFLDADSDAPSAE